jgi:tRNA pseudouridine55 synthase
MDGFLIVDKPAGWTSHDVVARVRRLAGQKRVGHTGTLDPDATGVLLVCLGSATRLIEYTDGYRKAYRATLALGVETDSQDASGAILATHDAGKIAVRDLESVLDRFRGSILQVPPMVSAVHHEGKRLYEIARAGGTVERNARPVTVHSLCVSGFQPGEVARADLFVECSAGTYVRTLCADIGTALGVGGHMETLRRTAVGRYTDAESITLDALAESGVAANLHPAAEFLPPEWPLIACDDGSAGELSHGRTIPASKDGAFAAALHGDRILAVLRRDGDVWRPAKVFVLD